MQSVSITTKVVSLNPAESGIKHHKPNLKIKSLVLTVVKVSLFHIHHVIYADANYNRTCGVMVSMLASSAVDYGFEPRLGQIKDYEIGICCM